MGSNPPGKQKSIYAEAIQIDSANRTHFHLSTVVYGSGTASLKAMVRGSFARGRRRNTRWLPRAWLNN